MPSGSSSGSVATSKRHASESSSVKKSSKTTCRKCKVEIKQGVESVECETCLHWFHGKCVEISGERVNFLSIGGIHWFCDSCDKDFTQLSSLEKEIMDLKSLIQEGKEEGQGNSYCSLEKEIKDLRSIIEKGKNEVDSLYSICSFDDRIKILESGLNTINETLSETCKKLEGNIDINGVANKEETDKLWSAVAAMPHQITSAFEKIDHSVKTHTNEVLVSQSQMQKAKEEKDSRAKNLVLFGVEENDDIMATSKIIEEYVGSKCHLKISLDGKVIHRLGRKNEENTKPRPIRIKTESETIKWDLLKRINSVKNDNIFARLDLSKQEQEQDFILRQELKKMYTENPDKKFKIHKGKIMQINQ